MHLIKYLSHLTKFKQKTPHLPNVLRLETTSLNDTINKFNNLTLLELRPEQRSHMEPIRIKKHLQPPAQATTGAVPIKDGIV